MTPMSRQFLQTAIDARKWVRELLQLIFATELLAPSRCLWLVSPWLRDVPILDNGVGGFQTLAPELPRAEVPLSLVLRELLGRGTRVVIVTRPDPGNRQVLDALGTSQDGAGRGLILRERSELHAKGIVGDAYCLVGSMNLTFNALENLTEMLVFQTDRRVVESLRLAFLNEYGGLP
jgi:phosphatidylserine/phosphatidylglycerophosphate/cardiolipin synthase-like enzyme